MEFTNELCRRTEACLSMFQAVSGHQTLADDDWFEDRAADFTWWANGLNAQKTGRSSLDYRLRDRPDIQKVISGLLDSLNLALKEYLRNGPNEDQDSTRGSQYDDTSEPDVSSSDSSWSEISGDDKQSRRNDALVVPSTADCNPRFYIETNLKLLAKISMAIKKSGVKLRHLKADEYLETHSKDDEYTQLRNHLLFLILVGPYEQKLFGELSRWVIAEYIPKTVEIVIRSWIVDPSRATPMQQRLIEANITRRNRIVYATAAANIVASSHFREAIPQPANEPAKGTKTLDVDTQKLSPIVDSSRTMPILLKPANSPTVKTSTATELGSQFALPITLPFEPKTGQQSVATRMTQTGIKQSYPVCPAKKGSFQCPYCVQVLSEDYTAMSRWRYARWLSRGG
ncbi:hypothetical protein JDV02_005643 [Purpureocillium takamizusanense]|uniref:Uncharacterized protein n=1 Tax=Purpureocillium takamizusanense TaxID=2060973 RepID=A0A9Q8VBZ4_9HYPO|nr:uncharacterized protein JDV02_005643 [Purpureocillium takamizusanense]UNI19461.1 hypothetical protein JDV02_005643 [Purpureocillium takamizusanense]